MSLRNKIIVLPAFKKRDGVTLVELLVVLAIVAIFVGVGLSFISTANRQFGFQATRGAVVSLLRYARSRAITTKTPTHVVFDIDKKEFYGLFRQNIRLWHMEDAKDGKTTGLNFDATVSGGIELVPEGRYGRAFLFNGTGVINGGKLSLKGNETGLILEAWIYPFIEAEQMIIKMQDDYYLMLTEDRELTAKFGDIEATSSPEIVSLRKWSQIKMSYKTDAPNLYLSQDSRLNIWLNDTLVAEADGITKAGDFDALTISAANPSFNGKIDEVKISVVIQVEKTQLEPPNISITSNLTPTDNKIKISFDAKGNLITTPGGGTSLVKVTLSSPSSRETFSVTVDSYGMVEVK